MKCIYLLFFLLCVFVSCRKTQNTATVTPITGFEKIIVEHNRYLTAIYRDGVVDSLRTACATNSFFTFSNDSTGTQRWDSSACYNAGIVSFRYSFWNTYGSSGYGPGISITNFGSVNAGVYCPYAIDTLNDTILHLHCIVIGTDIDYVFKAK